MELLRRVHTIRQDAGRMFEERMGGDLSLTQGVVLMALSSTPGCSQTALVSATGVDRSTLADVVRRLLKKGLLQRKRSKEDSRCYVVNFTPEGRRVLEAARAAARKTERELLASYPPLSKLEGHISLAA